MTAHLEPAAEHDCAGCGANARVWVTVGPDAVDPLCRACAARVASEPSFKAALAATHSEPSDDVLPPFRVVSPPQPAATRSGNGRRVSAMRRKCLGCSMVTSPPNLALHQRASGHQNYEEVSR